VHWLLAALLSLALPVVPARTVAGPAKPSPTSLGVAAYAKILCSAVFVSGRDPGEARQNSAYFLMPEADRSAEVAAEVDRDAKRVRVTLRGTTRTAAFYGDQGCIIHPEAHDGIFFTPRKVQTTLPDAASQPWPMGDATAPSDAWSAGVERDRLRAAVDLAFADPDGLTAAMVVVHKGQIVGERYMPGITKDTQLESWSMGKSLTATLVGLVVRAGAFGLDDPAPVPEWQAPGDARREIRIRDLLRMSSGLRFSAQGDAGLDVARDYPDHFYIYAGAIDAFAYSVAAPAEHPPNTVGRYRNSDPLTLGYLVKRFVTGRGEDYLTFPQRALFDRIGIRRQVLETDPHGNFLLTGYDYGTARNWARLGLLYLRDGVWQGERLLPEGWARFVGTAAPAWKEPEYGGQFWVNGKGQWPLPADTYFMSGAGGQHTFVVPSLDLVVVRMGHQRGAQAGAKALRASLAAIADAVK
jgi:CubicO group peptidase (beta-lactamase class C family)